MYDIENGSYNSKLNFYELMLGSSHRIRLHYDNYQSSEKIITRYIQPVLNFIDKVRMVRK